MVIILVFFQSVTVRIIAYIKIILSYSKMKGLTNNLTNIFLS